MPDYKFNSVVIGRFINYLMEDGKKVVAEKLMYDAFDIVKEKTKTDPMVIFDKAFENVSPFG